MAYEKKHLSIFSLINRFYNGLKKDHFYFYSTNTISLKSQKKTEPGSYNYVPGVKGYAPDIYPPKGISFECKKKPKYLDLHKTVAEPKLKNIKHERNDWKYKIKGLRRQYLTEYVSEQKEKDNKMLEEKKIKDMIEAKRRALYADKHHKYSMPSIYSLLKDEYPIKDPNKLERMERKRHNYEKMKDKNKKDRLHHFLTLYSRSEKFIISMEELEDTVNKVFQEIPTGSPPDYTIESLYNQNNNSTSSKNSCSVHPEIFDALLGTVDGGKLGPDELIELDKTYNVEKLNNKN